MTTHPKSADLDALALAIAQDLFGKTPLLRKCASEVNYCVRLSFDDGTSDRVIKLANHNPFAIEVEASLYPRMHAAGLPVPEVEYTHEDHAGSVAPFIVMPKHSDFTLMEFCKKNNEAVMRAAASSGRFIKEVHLRFAGGYMDFLALPRLGEQKLKNNGGLDKELEFDLIREDDSSLSEIAEKHFADLARPQSRRLIHGQPHNQNILVNAQGGICVVDFGETIGMSCPLRDLYTLLTSHDGWGSGTGDSEQRAAIIEGYGGIDTIEHEELLYWEAFHWVRVLNQFLGRAQDPGTATRLPGIKHTVRRILDGEGLVSSLPVA